jgi:hypothetical protein
VQLGWMIDQNKLHIGSRLDGTKHQASLVFPFGMMHAPEHAQIPGDLFGRAAFEQQMTFDRIAADLQMLAGVRGAQVRCLECGAVAGMPVRADSAGANWLERLIARSF